MKDRSVRLAAALCLAGTLFSSCVSASGAPTPTPASTPAAAPTTTPTPTKPAFSPIAALPQPTRVRWAIDKTDPPGPGPVLELFFDGGATGFRIIDGSGQVVLRLPIAGSGVFAADSCAVNVRAKTENFTYIFLDDASYRRFIASVSTYRVEADATGGRVVTLPLEDSGCRRG